LAGKEMAVGRYYMERGQYLAGINRFKNVIDQYQTTTHVPEALERLTESYVALGIYAEAERTASVLGYNYPGSPWYQDAYNLLTSKGLSMESAELPPVVTDPSKAPEGPPPPEPQPDQATNDLGLPPPQADSNSVIENQTGPGLPPPPPAVPTPPVEEQPVPEPAPPPTAEPSPADGGVFGNGGL
jgi:outer membrane protein assembly factor BamD